MFGNTEVWVVVIEWESDRTPTIIVAASEENAQCEARQSTIETMASAVDSYDPDGCRDFVLSDSALDDEHWLAELRELATVPWVTIERHLVEINPASA